MAKKLISVILLIAVFICSDIFIYNNFIKTNFNNTSEAMQAKSVELGEYLPFDPDSRVAKINSKTKISGNLPVLDGAAALYPVFSGVVSSIYPEDCVEFDGENFTENSFLQYTNTRGAYKRIVDGDVDIIFCAKPSDEQLQYAKDNNVELELVPIGKEAFVFIVNKDCTIDNLNIEQIKGIYSGKYTNWSQLGGPNKIIEPLTRNEGSGSQTTFLKFMGDTPVKKNIFAFLGKPIGFSFRYYVEGLVKDGAVKMISVEGVYPDKENIADDSYPITSNFYAIYRKDNKNENVQKVINWILSEEGQQLIEESGYSKLGGNK